MHLHYAAFTKLVLSGCHAYTGRGRASPLLERGSFIAVFPRFGMASFIDGIGVNKLLVEGF